MAIDGIGRQWKGCLRFIWSAFRTQVGGGVLMAGLPEGSTQVLHVPMISFSAADIYRHELYTVLHFQAAMMPMTAAVLPVFEPGAHQIIKSPLALLSAHVHIAAVHSLLCHVWFRMLVTSKGP